MTISNQFRHISVLSREVVEFLNCRAGGLYVDGTLGGGGHTARILDASAPTGRIIGIDWDEDAIKAARRELKDYSQRLTIVRENFANIKEIMDSLNINGVDGILLDLGVSSYHLESKERGFSFRFDSPLDMRMDRGQEESAYDIVNKYSCGQLEDVIRKFGEERWAKKIAKAITERRRHRLIATTKELSDLVASAIPRRFHPTEIHPATKTFQAIRIAVNDELNNLKKAIDDSVDLLFPGGRVAIISFHSLEDRIVKTSFRRIEKGCTCPDDFPTCVCGKKPRLRIVTKKPVTPSADEISKNPRARSAKLRVGERL